MKITMKYSLLAGALVAVFGAGGWLFNSPVLQAGDSEDVVWVSSDLPEPAAVGAAAKTVNGTQLWGLSKKQEKALEQARLEKEAAENPELDEALAEALRKGHYQLVGITQTEQLVSAHLLLGDGEVLTVTLGDIIGEEEQVQQIDAQSIRLSQNDTQTLLELYPMVLGGGQDE